MTPAEFTRWFANEAGRLAGLEPERAADEIGDHLARVDEGLGVETADTERGRELIVSALGDPRLFDLVYEICRGIQVPGWVVQALKPPLGFEFTLSADGVSVDASKLLFESLESPSLPGELGIRLLAPREAVDAVRRLGSLIVDTGLGERAAARIRHLEVEAASEGDAERYLKIAELGEFLAWYAKRHPTSCKH